MRWVDAAVADCDAVVSLLADPLGIVRSQGKASVVSAMRGHGVRRLVSVSAIGGRQSAAQKGALTRWQPPPGRRQPAGRGRPPRGAARRNRSRFTLIRPPCLTDGRNAGGPVVLPTARVRLSAALTRADLAEVPAGHVSGDGSIKAALTTISARQ